MHLLVLSGTTAQPPALIVLYLGQFPTDSDKLRCVKKVLQTSFQPHRCTLAKTRGLGVQLSTSFRVGTLIQIWQVLFTVT